MSKLPKKMDEIRESRPLLCSDLNDEEYEDLSPSCTVKSVAKCSAAVVQRSPLSTEKKLGWRERHWASNQAILYWTWRIIKRKQFFAFLAVVAFLLYINSTDLLKDDSPERINVLHYSHVPGMRGYLVWSERCKMPNIDPYLPEVMKYFKREKYQPCSTKKPLTTVDYNETTRRYVLTVQEKYLSSYGTKNTVNCCYQSIERNGTGVDADKDVRLGKCKRFQNSVQIPLNVDNLIVRCDAKNKNVYINGHPLMQERRDILERLEKWQQKDNEALKKTERSHKPNRNSLLSVLMIGIDSISRINLIRAMPKTAQYLYDNEWFEMSGYNKIHDNTFPNLMAILTGQNSTTTMQKCSPKVPGGLDNCDFLWRTFREHGYVTAYGEDEVSINTFNYLKVGFEKPPVDYYLRPFLLSAEKNLKIQLKNHLAYCLGYKHSAEFVYDYAMELSRRYKDKPYFGLFWTNTFSHNAISDCTSMDGIVVDYLKKFAQLGTLENTVVIFFSDHGMRFGPTRNTLSGHFEERLPFMFIWLPQNVKHEHPEFVNALSMNKNRLTNPYDLHMTLKHILAMTGRVENETTLQPAVDCPRCQTLLAPVPLNRACDDIGIEDHWCTCIPYQSIYKNSKLVQTLAKAAVDYINNYVTTFQNGSFAHMCATLQLKSIEDAYRAQFSSLNKELNESMVSYRIVFRTKPNNGLFEATMRYSDITETIHVTGQISRLNTYSHDSDCVEDGGAKKYCSCKRKKLI